MSIRLTRSLAISAAERARAAGRGRSTDATDGEVTVDCRECVAELPELVGFERPGSGASSRLVR